MTDERPNPPSSTQGGFFAVDRRCWANACNAGINAAAAYLLQARGTGRDQSTTSWSVQALEKYTGISRSRAKAAITALQSAGLTRQVQGGMRPRYEIKPWSDVVASNIKLTAVQADVVKAIGAGIQPTGRHRRFVDKLVGQGALERDADGVFHLPEPKWIWLPNEFITGAADETPPMELLRQSQDAMALRLAVDLYHAQNLREDGGVSRSITWYKYERFEVGEQAQFIVWGFQRRDIWVVWQETTEPHRRDEKDQTEKEREAGKNRGVDFFARMHLLEDIGLVEWVPYLVESDDVEAEIIHPLTINNYEPDRLENRLGIAAHQAGCAMLTEGQRDWAASNGLFLVAVPRHLTRVRVIGIARLRYRPKTKMTAGWWADLQGNGEQWIRRYTQLGMPATTAAASDAACNIKVISRRDQG